MNAAKVDSGHVSGGGEVDPPCAPGAAGLALVVLTCLGGAMFLLVGYMIAAAVVR